MKTIILIPCRMASVRLPGKPMIKIHNIPMIQHVWQKAIDSDIGEVVVACAEKEIYDFIIHLGGKAIITDPKLQSGTDRIHTAFMQIENSNNYDYIINLQGDMPLIRPDQIKKVLQPLENNYSIGTLATSLQSNEISNPNITKVKVSWDKKNVGQAKEFFRLKNDTLKDVYHHVGIYSFTRKSLLNFVKLPKSKNEKLLSLEQYRAMDSGISIGVTFDENIPISIDTKEDLITAESIIRENYEKN